MFLVDHAAFQDVQFIPTSPCERVLKNCKGVSYFVLEMSMSTHTLFVCVIKW